MINYLIETDFLISFRFEKFLPLLQFWRNWNVGAWFGQQPRPPRFTLVGQSISVPCDIRDTRKRSHATRRGRLADCFLLCYYRVFRVGILKKKRVGTKGARWGERYNIMEWEERNAGKRTNEIATIEPHVSNIRFV